MKEGGSEREGEGEGRIEGEKEEGKEGGREREGERDERREGAAEVGWRLHGMEIAQNGGWKKGRKGETEVD